MALSLHALTGPMPRFDPHSERSRLGSASKPYFLRIFSATAMALSFLLPAQSTTARSSLFDSDRSPCLESFSRALVQPRDSPTCGHRACRFGCANAGASSDEDIVPPWSLSVEGTNQEGSQRVRPAGLLG